MPNSDLSSLKIRDSARSKGAGGKILRIFAAALGVLVLLVGGILAFRTQTPAVEVASALPANDPQAQTLLNASGYVTPRRRSTVAAKITGRVTGVFFDEGMQVKKEQLLATLDDSDAKRAFAAAAADRNASRASIADLKVQLKNAEINLHRTKELVAENIQSQESLDTARTNAESLQAKILLAKSQVAASEARVMEAQQGVDNCIIRAPFSGVVVSKDAQVGEMVSPISAGGGFTRTGIATIVDMNSNEIEVDVNEAYIARVKRGQKVMATLDAYPDWHIPSHVRTIIPTADRDKGTVKVRISFDKLDSRILPDMGVKVAFLSQSDSAKKARSQGPAARAIIPQAAVRGTGAGSYVFAVRDGKIERRSVTLGRTIQQGVQVMAGVNPGDELVVQGPEKLKDGMNVEIRQ